MSRWKHRFKVTVFDENSFSEIRVFRGTPRGWAWLVGGVLTLVMGLIERLDAHINAVVVTDFDRALERARTLTDTGFAADQPCSVCP